MSYFLDVTQIPVADLLRRHADSVLPDGGDAWKFKLDAEVSLKATARIENDWLLLAATPGGKRRRKRPTAEHRARLLRHNGELRGGVKFALEGDPPCPLLATEIPLSDDEPGFEARFSGACAGFRQGAVMFSSKRRPSGHGNDEGNDPDTKPDTGVEANLAPLCEEAGWQFTTRADGRLAVQLDVPGAFCQALTERDDQGGVHLRAWLEGGRPTATASRCAVDVLLLSACRVVRMARAVAGPAEYCWEITLADPPDALGLDHALSSLSVACRMSAREINVLQDEAIAQRYLTVRGWSLLPSNNCSR